MIWGRSVHQIIMDQWAATPKVDPNYLTPQEFEVFFHKVRYFYLDDVEQVVDLKPLTQDFNSAEIFRLYE